MVRHRSLVRASAMAAVLAAWIGLPSSLARPSPASGRGALPRPAGGPLRAHPDNPRYFADGGGNAIYLTGIHTWSNLVDMGPGDPPQAFDFNAYLERLEGCGHNFIRLWAWELTRWDTRGNSPRHRKKRVHHVTPQPWSRSGPGTALDGKAKFDLKTFDPEYFRRLRTRVESAGRRGIYVAVMLFEGWGLQFSPDGWKCHPMHPENNINGIDGDANGDGKGLEIHTLGDEAVLAVEEAYVRKVVDTLNDLDNVLYEISNENHPPSTPWQYHMIDFIHQYEKGKPKQHPVGMTFQYRGGKNETLFKSPADWISPNPEGGYRDNPPPADGRKVIITDTDHLWGIGGNAQWVWKSFLRGLNPIFMDPYDGVVLGRRFDPQWEPIRRNLGHTRRYAQRMNLAAMTPRIDLSSTKYCLAHPGEEYLVYIPGGGKAVVNLEAASGELATEWFDPSSGSVRGRGKISGGARREFTPPFAGDAVLYIEKSGGGGRIRAWAKNSYYFEYKGKPVLLLGGSVDDNLFQIQNLNAHLDLLQSVGGNYVRNTMSSRDAGNVWPFGKKDDKYDLDTWNGEYWRRLESFLDETARRDIIVQIEVWATFDYYRDNWRQRNPFNPANNVNYTPETSRLPVRVDSHPVRAANPFFRSVPGADNLATALEYQRRFVDKILSYTLRHDHVLYCMDNETSVTPKWGAYWAQRIREKAAEAGKQVETTEMWDPWDLGHRMHGATFDHPELYSFVDISQNNHQKGQKHYDNALKRRRYLRQRPRPLTNTKIYGADGGRFGDSRDGVERFWRNVFCGHAAARFHRPSSGLGLSERTQRMIRGAREVTGAFNIFSCEPRNDLLSRREPNEAYCLAESGELRAVYFPRGGEVTVNSSATRKSLAVRWYDIDGGRWRNPESASGGDVLLLLKAPGSGQWAAVVLPASKD